MHTLAIGLGLGFVVSLQLGPLSLFLIRSTLRAGLRTGLAVGFGIAVVDALYAAAGEAGAASLLTIDALRLGLGVVGVTVLVVLGVRSLWTAFRVQTGDEIPADVASPVRAFLTSLGATASNPLTIVSWAAVFAAVSTATDASALAIVAGVGVGSFTGSACSPQRSPSCGGRWDRVASGSPMRWPDSACPASPARWGTAWPTADLL